MELLDHFHPPLKGRRHWESFHARWATSLADSLNVLLPKGYFAEVQVHTGGGRMEVEVATYEGEGSGVLSAGVEEVGEALGSGGTATATAVAVEPWAPPLPLLTAPAFFPDEIEVQVYNPQSGPVLVAAVELVSPGNKDRPDTRRAFAAKCCTYLRRGVGLAVVDVVTERTANLHDELMEMLGLGEPYLVGSGALAANSYRPVRRGEAERIEMWFAELLLGRSLPIVPLPLDKGLIVPLDLGGTYAEARRRSRLG